MPDPMRFEWLAFCALAAAAFALGWLTKPREATVRATSTAEIARRMPERGEQSVLLDEHCEPDRACAGARVEILARSALGRAIADHPAYYDYLVRTSAGEVSWVHGDRVVSASDAVELIRSIAPADQRAGAHLVAPIDLDGDGQSDRISLAARRQPLEWYEGFLVFEGRRGPRLIPIAERISSVFWVLVQCVRLLPNGLVRVVLERHTVRHGDEHELISLQLLTLDFASGEPVIVWDEPDVRGARAAECLRTP